MRGIAPDVLRMIQKGQGRIMFKTGRMVVFAGLSALMVFSASGSAALAAGDAAKGKKVFSKCRACHKVVEGKHGVGPSLYGVVDREVASADGFKKYSKAMKAYADGKVWSEELLDAYLENPKGVIKGTRMAFNGLKKPAQRADVIAYLRSLSE